MSDVSAISSAIFYFVLIDLSFEDDFALEFSGFLECFDDLGLLLFDAEFDF